MMKQVDIGEFREDLTQYAQGAEPIMVTRHGAAVGYFIPARAQTTIAEVFESPEAKALVEAFEKYGIEEEDLIEAWNHRNDA